MAEGRCGGEEHSCSHIQVETPGEYKKGDEAYSNSLCEIQLNQKGSAEWGESFQFSVWDSVNTSELLRILITFQFSVWDSYRCRQCSGITNFFLFQFSVWDSLLSNSTPSKVLLTFNSLCEIQRGVLKKIADSYVGVFQFSVWDSRGRIRLLRSPLILSILCVRFSSLQKFKPL